jgi:A/G-specific adenine glycosylase
MSAAPRSFATRVVNWQRAQGRKHLPWQNTQDPYRVWLSEIMLQQTQVSTVLDYYPRFLARFADVASLGNAHLDEVLALWSGLGYYSRARNLHRCAQTVLREHGGAFPRSAELLRSLPGIGRSTAAAIAAFCFGERAAILDGNVKRVLARHAAFGEDLSRAKNERALWDIATERLPTPRAARAMPAYTQGLMDLGASICSARRPQCLLCPVQQDCQARLQGQAEHYPVKTKKLKRSAQSLWLLWLRHPRGDIWLAQRPHQGVWGGLFTPPIFDSETSAQTLLGAAQWKKVQPRSVLMHPLTHKDLYLHPLQLSTAKAPKNLEGQWYTPAAARALGLPAPVRVMLSDDS